MNEKSTSNKVTGQDLLAIDLTGITLGLATMALAWSGTKLGLSSDILTDLIGISTVPFMIGLLITTMTLSLLSFILSRWFKTFSGIAKIYIDNVVFVLAYLVGVSFVLLCMGEASVLPVFVTLGLLQSGVFTLRLDAFGGEKEYLIGAFVVTIVATLIAGISLHFF